MPGYVTWWKYAQGSPYYKEYFKEQWKIYSAVKYEIKQANKIMTVRNIVCAILLIYWIIICLRTVIVYADYNFIYINVLLLLTSIIIVFVLRKCGNILCKSIGKKRVKRGP